MLKKIIGSLFVLCYCLSVWAAIPINVAEISSFSTLQNDTQIQFQTLSEEQDFNQTLHRHIRQLYQGIPILGADALLHESMHYPQYNSSNGKVYTHLTEDLGPKPYTTELAKKAEQYAAAHLKLTSCVTTSRPVIYIDSTHKAHWAYRVHVGLAETESTLPQSWVVIVDALQLTVLQQFNEIKTLQASQGGGYGGNEKIGQSVYDGLGHDLPVLDIVRDEQQHVCYLKNKLISVRNAKTHQLIHYPCEKVSESHGKVYWDGANDAVNGAFSPANDALYEGKIIMDLYQSWYHLPVLLKNNKPMRLSLCVHKKIDNAYWDGHQMTFGDGVTLFYPLVSLGVAAHEISHGFTASHSDLSGLGQAGGLNEAFSDMAAQAAEYFATGKNSWEIGGEIMKAKNKAIRYMSNPTKDCEGQLPGDDCSIDQLKAYRDDLDVHFTAGIFDKAFYLLARSQGWTVKKAFDVMVQANRYYWTPDTDFTAAACGVLRSAKDYGYDEAAVRNAFLQVGIETTQCD